MGLNQRPSSHILALKNPYSSWSKEDHALAVAFQILEDELCQHCGYPTWVCQSDNNALDWEVSKYSCSGEKAKSVTPAGKKRGDLREWEYRVARPKMRKELPLPSRDEYYKQLEEEARIHGKVKKKD